MTWITRTILSLALSLFVSGARAQTSDAGAANGRAAAAQDTGQLVVAREVYRQR